MPIMFASFMFAADTPILSGDGPWRVDPSACRLERTYSGGTDRGGTDHVLVMLSPDALSASLIVNNNYERQLPGDRPITMLTVTGPAGATSFPLLGDEASRSSPKAKTTNFGYGLFSETLLDAMAAGETLNVARLGGPSLAFRIDDVARSRPMLDQCLAASIEQLGIDPAIRAGSSIRPKPLGDTSGWFDRRRYQGFTSSGRLRVTMLVTVSPEGRATACRPHDPSTNREALAVACAELMDRGRFTPARDGANNPAIGYTLVPLLLSY